MERFKQVSRSERASVLYKDIFFYSIELRPLLCVITCVHISQARLSAPAATCPAAGKYQENAGVDSVCVRGREGKVVCVRVCVCVCVCTHMHIYI
jgi:hypothetical protein